MAAVFSQMKEQCRTVLIKAILVLQLSWKARPQEKSKRFLYSQSNFLKDIRFVFNKQLFQIAKFPALAVPPTPSAALGQCLPRSRSVVLHFACFFFCLFFLFPAVLCKANVLI